MAHGYINNKSECTGYVARWYTFTFTHNIQSDFTVMCAISRLLRIIVVVTLAPALIFNSKKSWTFVSAQVCPPPGLEDVVDTSAKCSCFWELV